MKKIRAVLLALLVALVVLPGLAGPAAAGPKSSGQKVISQKAITLPPVTADQMAARAETWLHPKVPYSQVKCWPSGKSTPCVPPDYRADCSGYVSMMLGLSTSLDTAQLAQPSVTTPIAKQSLQRGDLMLLPKTGDAGHVVMFDRWVDATHYLGYEQTGSDSTQHREIPYPYFNGRALTPYRYNNITPSSSSQPAIVLTSGGGLQVVARDTGGNLRNVWANKDTGVWTDQGSLTSGVTGDPAVTVGSDGNTVAFYRGTDGRLHEQWMDRNTGQWGGVGPITNVVLSGDPVATAITDKNLQVLARDSGGGLHSLWMDHADGIWHDQGVVAGATDVVGTPAITVGSDGNTAAVYRGTDARLHIVWMDKDTGIWGAAPPVSQNLASDPTLTVNTAGNLQVLVRNTSGQLLDIWMDKTTGAWTDQGAVATNVIGNPATTIGFDGNTVVAYRGSDNRLYESWMDKATGDWGSVGPLTTVAPTGDPALALDAVGNLNIVMVGGHTLYQTWMNTGAQWAGAQALAQNIA